MRCTAEILDAEADGRVVAEGRLGGVERVLQRGRGRGLQHADCAEQLVLHQVGRARGGRRGQLGRDGQRVCGPADDRGRDGSDEHLTAEEGLVEACPGVGERRRRGDCGGARSRGGARGLGVGHAGGSAGAGADDLADRAAEQRDAGIEVGSAEVGEVGADGSEAGEQAAVERRGVVRIDVHGLEQGGLRRVAERDREVVRADAVCEVDDGARQGDRRAGVAWAEDVVRAGDRDGQVGGDVTVEHRRVRRCEGRPRVARQRDGLQAHVLDEGRQGDRTLASQGDGLQLRRGHRHDAGDVEVEEADAGLDRHRRRDAGAGIEEGGAGRLAEEHAVGRQRQRGDDAGEAGLLVHLLERAGGLHGRVGVAVEPAVVAREGHRRLQVEAERQGDAHVGGHLRGRQLGVGAFDPETALQRVGEGGGARLGVGGLDGERRAGRGRAVVPLVDAERLRAIDGGDDAPGSACGDAAVHQRDAGRVALGGEVDARGGHARRGEGLSDAGGRCSQDVELQGCSDRSVGTQGEVDARGSGIGILVRIAHAVEHVEGPAGAVRAARVVGLVEGLQHVLQGGEPRLTGRLVLGVGVGHLLDEELLDAADRVDGVGDGAAHQRQLAVLGVLQGEHGRCGLREA